MQKYLMGLRNPLKCIVRIVGEICICWGENDLAVGKFLIEERPYPHLLLHRSAGPALPQPVDNL